MKNRGYVVFAILIGIFLVLYGIKFVEYIEIQSKNELLQKTNELLREENEKLQSTYTKLEKELVERKEFCKRAEAELSDWKKNANIEGWQVFYGKWHTDRYYEVNAEGIQKLEDDKSICIQHDHISMTGHYLTSEPIYSVAVRIKGDVVESVKEIGVENSELITLLKEGHYAEITFDNITNWDREVLEAEKDMIQNVKYYLVDNDTMLCVSSNSSRVYILGRVWH